jgi:hypothetical protein
MRNWVSSADLRVPGWSMLRRRSSSVLVLWSSTSSSVVFRRFLVLLGRGHRTKEIEILALRTSQVTGTAPRSSTLSAL